MCDCYSHKCECCEELIPMHIADFEFPREDFKIWCEKHIDQAPFGAIIFETVEPEEYFDLIPVGWKCAILGPKTEANHAKYQRNHPNLYARMKCRIVT